MNNTFRDCRSKVNITGLLSDLGAETAISLSILGLSSWHDNWNVRNSYSYVATATKIRVSRCDFETYQISAQDTL